MENFFVIVYAPTIAILTGGAAYAGVRKTIHDVNMPFHGDKLKMIGIWLSLIMICIICVYVTFRSWDAVLNFLPVWTPDLVSVTILVIFVLPFFSKSNYYERKTINKKND